jgi:hypothetical protein
MAYWRTIAKRASKATQFLQPWKIYSTVGTAVLVPFGSYLVGRLTLLSAVYASILVGLGSWVLLTVGEFLYRFALAPAEMHREALAEIETQTELVRQLREQPPPITFEIEMVSFGGPANVHINFKVHNTGPATILHDWALYSKSEPKIETRLVLPQGGWKLVEIGSGKILHDHLSFQVHGKALADIQKSGMGWHLKFSDTSKKSYEATLSETLYRLPS